MTVYVDDAWIRFGRMRMCHMVADTDEELHRMADGIGVGREHWQRPDQTSGSHYDVCMSKRALAVTLGATAVTQRQLAAMNHRRRVSGALGGPSDAVEWLRVWYRRHLR